MKRCEVCAIPLTDTTHSACSAYCGRIRAYAYLRRDSPHHSCDLCGVTHDTCKECGCTRGDNHSGACLWMARHRAREVNKQRTEPPTTHAVIADWEDRFVVRCMKCDTVFDTDAYDTNTAPSPRAGTYGPACPTCVAPPVIRHKPLGVVSTIQTSREGSVVVDAEGNASIFLGGSWSPFRVVGTDRDLVNQVTRLQRANAALKQELANRLGLDERFDQALKADAAYSRECLVQTVAAMTVAGGYDAESYYAGRASAFDQSREALRALRASYEALSQDDDTF